MFVSLREFILLEKAISTDEMYDKFYKKDISKEDFDKVVTADPTSFADRKKAGKFTKWLLKQVKAGLKIEDLYKFTDYLKVFDKHKDKIRDKKNSGLNPFDDLPDWRNIDLYTYQTLFDAVEPFLDVKTGGEITKEIKAATEKFMDTPDLLIVIPTSAEAACYYGKGTQWCTASTDDDGTPSSSNMFDEYNREGPLFVIISKNNKDSEGRNLKWQMHIPSGQFMDYRDNSYNPMEVLNFGQFKACVERTGLVVPEELNVDNLDFEKIEALIDKHYNESGRESIDSDWLKGALQGINQVVGFEQVDISDLHYELDDEMLERIKKRMMTDGAKEEDVEDLNDRETLELIKSEYFDIESDLRMIYTDCMESAAFNDMHKAIVKAIKGMDPYAVMLKSFDFDMDDVDEGLHSFTVESPHYGFDTSVNSKEFKEAFEDYF